MMTEHSRALENWSAYSRYAELSFGQKNFAVAESLILLALTEAENFGKADSKYLDTLQKYGDILFQATKYQSCITIYSKCLDVKTAKREESTLAAVLIKCKLADAFFNLGHYARAKKLFEQARVFFELNYASCVNFAVLVNARLAAIQKIQDEMKNVPKFYMDHQMLVKPLPPITELRDQRLRSYRLPVNSQVMT